MLLRRLAYRKFLRDLADDPNLTPEQAHAVRFIRLRPQAINHVASDLDVMVESKGQEFTAAEFGDGTFLKFLWDNREEILTYLVKVVETLMKLFG